MRYSRAALSGLLLNLSPTAMHRLSVAALLVLVAGCTSAQRTTSDSTAASEPAPTEAFRLAAALEPLGVSLLPPGLAEGADGWSDLTWTVRYAIESASTRRHFLVRGDEVDVLVYDSGRQAEGEGERIQGAIGAAPLAARPDSALANVPASYFVAGPLVVRQRGADPDVLAALTRALGAPVEDARSSSGPSFFGIDSASPPPALGYDPYYGYSPDPPLYQGKNAPSWSVNSKALEGPYGAVYKALYYSD